MIKKLLAFAAAAALSTNAFAGYVQYNFSYGAPHSGLDGFFVQHNTDQSIAFFGFWLNDPATQFGGQFFPFGGEGTVLLTDATTRYRNNGPTSFAIHDSFGADHGTYLQVSFSRSTGGRFSYVAQYDANLWANVPPELKAGTVSGYASKGEVDPLLAAELDSYGGYHPNVPRIVPTYIPPHEVPEPASLALLTFGAAGLIATARRRRLAR